MQRLIPPSQHCKITELFVKFTSGHSFFYQKNAKFVHLLQQIMNITQAKKFFLSVTLLFTMCNTYTFGSKLNTESAQLKAALEQLDEDFNDRSVFQTERMRQIDALKLKVKRAPTWQNFESVARAYEGVNNDSALFYFQYAVEHAPEGRQYQMLRAQQCALLPMSGFVDNALSLYNNIDTTVLTSDDMPEYHDAGRRMYTNITAFFARYPNKAMVWSNKVMESQKKLMSALKDNPESNLYREVYGEYLLRTGRHDLAETMLKEVFETEPENSDLRARAAHVLSHIVSNRDDTDLQLYYLAKAVSADLRSGNVELASLQDLGMALQKRGDEERAFRFLNSALNDASQAGTWIRIIQAAQAVPMVQEEHLKTMEKNRQTLVWIVVALGITLVALAISLARMVNETRNLRRMRSKLATANDIKGMYISQFLALCSIHMDRLTQFSNLVKRKVAAGKYDDITRMISSGKFIDEQSQEFFNVFDDAFLHLYPTFVEDVNKLLQPDKRIVLKDNEKMNTDLRILAFMRMGLEDSGRIAQILNYSVNTIYAYRNKMKARAIDRNTFETDIMRIPSL